MHDYRDTGQQGFSSVLSALFPSGQVVLREDHAPGLGKAAAQRAEPARNIPGQGERNHQG